MSEAAFTDSTTPRLENCRTVAPFSGSSTKTTSPSCSCAKCVMPMVTTSPSARTHSCSLEYLRSSGTALTPLSPCCTSGSLRSPPASSSLRSSLVERCLHYRSGNVAVADAHRQTRSDLRNLRRHVRERDVLVDRRAVRPARHGPDGLAVVHHLMPVTGDTAVHHEPHDAAARAGRLLRGDHVVADEVLVELAGPTEPRLDRVGGLVDLVPVEREPRLETEGVTCAEPDGGEAVRLAR